MRVVETRFPAGDCPIHVFGPEHERSAPIVLFFMDAFGPRPSLFDIAGRLVGEGYRVLLPDLFYAHRPYRPLDPRSLFAGGKDRRRLMEMLAGLDQAALDADVTALLEFCNGMHGKDAPIGATGYCMGGPYVLTAATLSRDVIAGACFHASMLAPETGDSAHLRLERTRAAIYIGVAGIDPTFGEAEKKRLAAALNAGGVKHVIETYEGAAHGFVMPDLPVHDAAAAERGWSRLRDLLRQSFA